MRLDDLHYLDRYRDALSEFTLRAKWIVSADEHEDRPGQSLATRNHEVIKQWVSERNGEPAIVHGSADDRRSGTLEIDFPGYVGENLQPIDWQSWLEIFDERELVFVYQEHNRDGQQSTFFHFDSPFREHD